MENATKALLIGAGMLFTIAIVSIAWAAYTNITGYYQEEQKSVTSDQLANFNKEYEAYNRDDVTGFELVSLINKVINYNANNAVDESLGFRNTDINFQKMYVKFTITNSNLTNGTEVKSKNLKVKLFDSSTYDSENTTTNTKLQSIMKRMQSLENTYGANVLSKLVSDRDNLTIYGGNGSKDLKRVLGKNISVPGYNKEEKYSEDGAKQILEYEQYIEFKRAEFKCTKTDYNNSTGRITKLEFTQK